MTPIQQIMDRAVSVASEEFMEPKECILSTSKMQPYPRIRHAIWVYGHLVYELTAPQMARAMGFTDVRAYQAIRKHEQKMDSIYEADKQYKSIYRRFVNAMEEAK